MKKVLVLLLFCVLWTNKTYSQELGPDRLLHKPGYVNWYLLDVDGDKSPDVITDDFFEAERFSKETDREVYVVRRHSNQPPQVRIIEAGDSITIVVEDIGTVIKPGDKILLAK